MNTFVCVGYSKFFSFLVTATEAPVAPFPGWAIALIVVAVGGVILSIVVAVVVRMIRKPLKMPPPKEIATLSRKSTNFSNSKQFLPYKAALMISWAKDYRYHDQTPILSFGGYLVDG